MAETRRELIAWCWSSDMDGGWELGEPRPCSECGEPVRTVSISFVAAFHLRCLVRRWEQFERDAALFRAAPNQPAALPGPGAKL